MTKTVPSHTPIAGAPSPAGTARSYKIAIVAGEVSGDLLGAGLLRELKRLLPGAQFEGIGGPRMQAQGCRSLYDMDDLTVIGLEGITKIPRVLNIRRQLISRFLASAPDVYIGVDAPDFNLTLEQRLRAGGIPTVQYVGPTVWAWRGYRIRKIRRAVGRILTLFPFEANYYRQHQVPVTFVGHPLADQIPDSYDPAIFRKDLGLPRDKTIVALLPGSRTGELRRHGSLFVQTAKWLYSRYPEIHFVAPFASHATQQLFEEAIAREGGMGLPITRLLHKSREALAACDVTLLASGTATLEAALLKKPMVVTYKVSKLSEILVKTFAHVRMYALPNHLVGRRLVPEFVQEDAVPEALGAAVEQYLKNPEQAAFVQAALGEMHRALKQNADVRAAEAVVEILHERDRGQSQPQ